MPVSFGVLGSLEVSVDGRPVRIGGRQRALLVALLLHANKVVGFDELVEAVWGERNPVHPRAAVHTLVTRLRNVLREVVIEGSADGYRIVLDDGAVDLHRFESAVLAARAAGDREAEALGEALGMWRGEPLDGVDSAYLQRHEVPRLTELRLQILERKLELDVSRGELHLAISQLRQLTAGYPFRERFWALLIAALSQCGRQAEAVEAYSAIRQHLVDELGVEPGHEVRQAYQALLIAGAAEHGAWRAECRLPLDVHDFTGRDKELARLQQLLRPGSTVPLVIISGQPGAGKSALAIRVAHRLIPRFSDGQWFCRLAGASSTRRSAVDLLGEMLRTMGTDPASIPAEQDERAALLRARLADRNVLIVLDDAADADQVASLLPGRSGSAVLVTSRSDLAGLSVLYGGIRVPVDPLTVPQARELLVRMIGPSRCAEEMQAVAEIVDLCGRLPLALRIAAANVASRPSLSITGYVTDLRTGDRLAKLATRGEQGFAVRAAFDLSYVALRPVEQRGFRLLGLAPGPDIGTEGAAALFGCPVAEVTEILDRLAAANLIEARPGGRFGFHDLLRIYAAARAEEEQPDTATALRRLFDWYLHSAHAASTRSLASLYISPLPIEPVDIVAMVFVEVAEALSWLEIERPNLIAAAAQASAAGLPEYTWLITDAVRPDLHVRYQVAELEHLAGLGLLAARRNGDQRAEAAMILADGGVKAITGRFSEAVTTLHACRELAATIGEVEIETAARIHLASTLLELGEPRTAHQAVREAVVLATRPIRRASALLCLGEALIDMDELTEAADVLNESLACAETSASQIHAALAHRLLGDVLRETGDFEGALRHFTAAFDAPAYRESRREEPMLGLASIYRETGRLELALDYSQSAVQAARQVGHKRYEADALISIGSVQLLAGTPEAAMTSYQQAYDLAKHLGHVRAEIEALAGMGSAGHPEAAAQGVALARRHGLRLLERKASRS